MKHEYKIVGKTNQPMPDLLINANGSQVRIDPFVGCVIGLSRFKDNLKSINQYIDTLIGQTALIDLEACGNNGISYYPYSRKEFRIKK